jgi:PAS domain S-box-containing protein
LNPLDILKKIDSSSAAKTGVLLTGVAVMFGVAFNFVPDNPSVKALITAILITTAFVISRRLTRSLREITAASKKIAEGDLAVSVPVRSKDEVGMLAKNFNIMLEKLNGAQTELANYAKNLEHVVQLRTERLNDAMKELQRQKEFVEKLISTVGALIVVLDTGGKLVMINKACEEATGYKDEEVKGRSAWDFLREDSLEATKKTFSELLTLKTPNSNKNVVLTKDGRERDILWNNTVLTEENGDVKYVISTGIDVTEKKLIEEYLVESQRLQSVATLVRGLSHNFNNILVGVLGYAGLLRMKLSNLHKECQKEGLSHDISELIKYIDTIESSAGKAADLIKNLLLFSKKTEYMKIEMSLNDIIRDVLIMLAPSLPGYIAIETRFDESLRPVKADRDRIKQALLNILINAADAMNEGGTLRVETSDEDISIQKQPMQPAGRYAAITIRDTGHGMDEETKSRMYEPFFTTKGLLDHTGLGLSITHSIIKDHNGYITVDSEPGKGTTFTIYFPAE